MDDLKLIDEPISTEQYQIYDVEHLPKIFLGINVKNKLDEKRLEIKKKYNPKLIAHFKQDIQLEPVFLYGIEITPNKQIEPILEILCDGLKLKSYTYQQFVQSYKSLLASYGLSCHNCYSYLSDGVYPIDVSHLNSISKKDFSNIMESGFAELVKRNNKPWYTNLYNFNLYVLCKAYGYNNDFTLNNV